MRRKLLFSYAVFQILIWGCLFTSSITGQNPDLTEKLIGEWRGPKASYEGRQYGFTVVFTRENDGFQVFTGPGINLGFDKSSPFHTGTDLKFSEKGLSFVVKGTERTAFYEIELSPDGKDMTARFSYELPSKPDSRITWKLQRVPICNHSDELSLAAKDLWEKRRFEEVRTAYYACYPLPFYEDKMLTLSGLLALRGNMPYSRPADNYDKYDYALRELSKALNLNRQNPIALYARAHVYYEQALQMTAKTNTGIENNKKENVYRRMTDQQIEERKDKAKRESINLIDKAISDYSMITYYDAFDFTAYVKRAQTYYAKWSKYDPNEEYLKIALKDYKTAIDMNPLSYKLFYERAQIYLHLGDTEKYEADMKRVLELKVNK